MLSKINCATRYMDKDEIMKIGMFLKPDFMSPFFIVAMIADEKNEVIINVTIAKILKSLYFTPVPVKLIPMPTLAEAAPVAPNVEPRP